MKVIEGGVTAAKGFKANGMHVGLRKNRTKRDLALIASEKRAACAAVYTTNLVKGAPLTRFVVYTAAALAGTSETISARSFLEWFLRMPQWMPLAVKPVAAQTPPEIIFIALSSDN